jgi:polyisoprenoid-binding protein YceI
MRHLFFAIFIIALGATSLHAQKFITENGRATFYSKVPLHSFEGNSDKLVGLIDLDSLIVDFYIDLETLDTGNGKRDKDMRLTLETKEYPFAEFYGQIQNQDLVLDNTPTEVTVKGDFTIHGVTRNIEVSGTLSRTNEGLKLNASWILNLKDYNIVPPKILFIKVDENQEIEIEALLKPLDQ